MASDNGATKTQDQESEDTINVNAKMRKLENQVARLNAEQRQKTIRTVQQMRKGMEQYGGNRNLAETFGHERKIDYEDLEIKFNFNPLARSIVKKPPKKTWQDKPEVVQVDEDGDELPEEEKNDFESDVEALSKRVDLWETLYRADILSRIGKYGVIMLGTGDLSSDVDFMKPLEKNSLVDAEMVNYMSPYDYGDADIHEYETDVSSSRFGKPKFYEVHNEVPQTDKDEGESDDNEEEDNILIVHHSRIIHIAEEAISDEVLGTPALQSVYNYLQDLDKVVGSAAESFFQLAKPNLHFNVDKDAGEVDWDTLDEEIDDFMMDYLRSIRTQGVEVERVGGDAVDPSPAFNTIVEFISTGTPMNKRNLIGNLTGERASTEDREQFNDRIRTRRKMHVGPNIIRKTIDRMMHAGVLEDANYKIEWPELDPLNELEKSEIRLNQSKTIKNLAPLGNTGEIYENIDEAREIADLDPRESSTEPAENTEEMANQLREEEVEQMSAEIEEGQEE